VLFCITILYFPKSDYKVEVYASRGNSRMCMSTISCDIKHTEPTTYKSKSPTVRVQHQQEYMSTHMHTRYVEVMQLDTH